jgi:DHA2 family multidrug resistance protein
MSAVTVTNVGRQPVNKWLVTVSVTFGTLMGAIDASIVNVAVPHLRGALGSTVEEITWVTTGFIIATVLVMPLTAFLGRLFGQKRVYMFCLALFIVGSMLCGVARSLWTLVLFRVIQGFGAGALQPTEQAILRQTFPPEEQGMAMALFGVAVLIGPAVGPTLGGWIVDNWSWPWIFYINVPVGLLGLFMVQRFVHEPEDILAANRASAAQQRANVDWIGITLLSVGLAAMVYVIEEGGRNDWFESKTIIALTVVAVVALVGFVWQELTTKAPVVNLTLFKDKVFLSGTLIGSVMFAMLMSVTFLLPVFMQELLGFNAMQSGLALMPRSLIMLVATPIVGKLYNKVSPRAFVAFGVLIFSFTGWQMSHYTLQTNAAGIVVALLLQGIAFSCLWVPLTTVALSSVPRTKMSDATGLNTLIRQIGGSLGLAAFATLINRYMTQARGSLSAHVSIGSTLAYQRLAGMQQLLTSHGLDAESAKQTSYRALNGIVMQQATVLTFEKLFLLAGILFLLVLPLLAFLKSPTHVTAQQKVDVHVEV